MRMRKLWKESFTGNIRTKSTFFPLLFSLQDTMLKIFVAFLLGVWRQVSGFLKLPRFPVLFFPSKAMRRALSCDRGTKIAVTLPTRLWILPLLWKPCRQPVLYSEISWWAGLPESSFWRQVRTAPGLRVPLLLCGDHLLGKSPEAVTGKGLLCERRRVWETWTVTWCGKEHVSESKNLEVEKHFFFFLLKCWYHCVNVYLSETSLSHEARTEIQVLVACLHVVAVRKSWSKGGGGT